MDHEQEDYYDEDPEDGVPYFDLDTSQTNLTSVVGAVARLRCSVHHLGSNTVSLLTACLAPAQSPCQMYLRRLLRPEHKPAHKEQ